MNVELNYQQRAQLELIALYSGKPAAQVLLETAQFLMNVDAHYFPPSRHAPSQQFLPEEELEARLARILRH